MKITLLSLLITVLNLHCLIAEQSYYDLNLQNTPSLKSVYDAGMRPWRVTNDRCMVGGRGDTSLHQVTMKFPESTSFTFPSESTSFSVFSDYDLSQISVKTVALSTDQAKSLVKTICASLKLRHDDLDSFFDNLQNKTFETNSRSARTSRNGIQFYLLCRISPRMEETLAEVTLIADWQPGTEAERRKRMLLEPMQPPKSYEGASMEPPSVPAGQSSVPEHSMDYYKNQFLEKR